MDKNVEYHRWWLDHGTFLLPSLTEVQGRLIYDHFQSLLEEVNKEHEDHCADLENDLENDLEKRIGEIKDKIADAVHHLETLSDNL